MEIGNRTRKLGIFGVTGMAIAAVATYGIGANSSADSSKLPAAHLSFAEFNNLDDLASASDLVVTTTLGKTSHIAQTDPRATEYPGTDVKEKLPEISHYVTYVLNQATAVKSKAPLDISQLAGKTIGFNVLNPQLQSTVSNARELAESGFPRTQDIPPAGEKVTLYLIRQDPSTSPVDYEVIGAVSSNTAASSGKITFAAGSARGTSVSATQMAASLDKMGIKISASR